MGVGGGTPRGLGARLTLEQKEARAAEMRASPTPPEARLWERLKGNQLGVPFRSQVVLLGYIADFYCGVKKLVVEVDGKHHKEDEQLAWDGGRDAAFARQGIQTLRVAAGRLFQTGAIDSVVEEIKATLRARATAGTYEVGAALWRAESGKSASRNASNGGEHALKVLRRIGRIESGKTKAQQQTARARRQRKKGRRAV